MAHFEASILTGAAANGTAYALLQHTGTTGMPRMRVKEFTWTTRAATQSPVCLVRAAGIGTPSGQIVGAATDDLETTIAKGALSLPGVTPPTIAGSPVFFRSLYAAAVAGSGIPWAWADGELTISPGGALLLWNFDVAMTGSVLSAYAKWEE